MAYKLLYTKTAFSDIKGLDIPIRKRIKKKLELFVTDPMIHAKRLINSSLGTYRWRIGDHRVIFDIDEETIIVLRVKHRRDSYK